MQRFLITNTDKFTGQAELVYNANGTLCIIDCSDTDMNEQVMLHFKQAAPVKVSSLGRAFTSPTVIVEAGFEVTFEKFYKDYPLKRNRYKAEKAWAKLNDTDRIKAWHSLSGYRKYLGRTNCFPMIADNYLNNRHYETEWHKV